MSVRISRSIEQGRWGERIVYRLSGSDPRIRQIVEAHRYMKDGVPNGHDRDAHRDQDSHHTGLKMLGREWSFPADYQYGVEAVVSLEATLAAIGVTVEERGRSR